MCILPPFLPELSRTLAQVLSLGSRVITVDKQLVSSDSAGGSEASTGSESDSEPRWCFELVAPPLERPNYNTLQSTGYVYEMVDPGRAGRAGGAMKTLL